MRALLGAVLVLVALATGFDAPARAEIQWQEPTLIDAAARFRDVSCPTAALCVAVGGDNSTVLVSREVNATGRVWAPPLQLGPPTSFLYAVSCPAENACVALGGLRSGPDQAAYVLTTTNPSDPAGWRSVPLTGRPRDGMSCPAVTFCVASTDDGLFVSHNPFDVTPAWVNVASPGGHVDELRCPSESLCVGVADAGIVMSTAPGDVTVPWTVAYNQTPSSIACPSVGLCFAAPSSGGGRLLVFNGGAWGEIQVPSLPVLSQLACPAVDACLGITGGGDQALLSHTPSIGADWAETGNGQVARSPGAMACYAVDSCVIVGLTGYVTSGIPRAAGSPWSGPRLLDAGEARIGITGLGCPTVRHCFAATSAPDGVYESTAPADGAASFGYAADLASPASAFACRRAAACALVQGSRLLTSRGATWQPGGRAGSNLAAAACPTARLCVAAGGARPVVSIDGGKRWTRSRTSSTVRFTAVACPSATLCVAAGSLGGRVGFLRSPARRGSRWKVARLGDAPGGGRSRLSLSFQSLACPTTRLCVALDWFGRIATTTRPTGGRRAWRVHQVAGFSGSFSAARGGIACPTAKLCVAIDSKGTVGYSTDPAARAASWTVTPAFKTAGRVVGSVACPSDRLCLVGYGGQLITFSRSST